MTETRIPYRHVPAMLAGPARLPMLELRDTAGYAVIHTGCRWWWLDYTRSAPLSPRQVADLVANERVG